MTALFKLFNISISFVPSEVKVVHEVYCDRCQSKMNQISQTKFRCLTCNEVFLKNPDEDTDLLT